MPKRFRFTIEVEIDWAEIDQVELDLQGPNQANWPSDPELAQNLQSGLLGALKNQEDVGFNYDLFEMSSKPIYSTAKTHTTPTPGDTVGQKVNQKKDPPIPP